MSSIRMMARELHRIEHIPMETAVECIARSQERAHGPLARLRRLLSNAR